MSSIPSGTPESLKPYYEDMFKMKEMLETMKKQQQLRGIENYKQRMAQRQATHNSWRQMKGMQLFLHELNHPGNKPFAIGLGYVSRVCYRNTVFGIYSGSHIQNPNHNRVTVSALLYLYVGALRSEEAKAESTYWQRYHAHKDKPSSGH